MWGGGSMKDEEAVEPQKDGNNNPDSLIPFNTQHSKFPVITKKKSGCKQKVL